MMSRAKDVLTALGTLTCALGIGFAMQNTDSAERLYRSADDHTTELGADRPVLQGAEINVARLP